MKKSFLRLRFGHTLGIDVPAPSTVTTANTFRVWSVSCQLLKSFAKASVYPAAILRQWFTWNNEWNPRVVLVWKVFFFFFFFWWGGTVLWKFLFMPSEDGIIGLDLRQIEHPEAGPSMSSCWNENKMQKLIIMVTRALWYLAPSCFFRCISCCSHHPPIHYTGINREAVELSDLLCLRIFAFAFPPSRIFPFSSYAWILFIFYSMQIYTRFLPNTPSFPWPSSLGVFYSNAVFPSLWKQGTLAHIWQLFHL